MRSGLAFVEDYVDGESSNCLDMLFGAGSADHAAYAAALPLEHPPGSFWNYSSGTTNILCRVLGDLVSDGAADPAARESADPRLPRPAAVRSDGHGRRRPPLRRRRQLGRLVLRARPRPPVRPLRRAVPARRLRRRRAAAAGGLGRPGPHDDRHRPRDRLRLRAPLVDVAGPARTRSPPTATRASTSSCCPSATPSWSTSARPTPPSATASWPALRRIDRCASRPLTGDHSDALARRGWWPGAIASTPPASSAAGDGRAAADPARPVEADASVPRWRPVRADDQGRSRSSSSSTSSCCRSSPASADAIEELIEVDPAFLVVGLGAPGRRLVRLLPAHPVGARRGRATRSPGSAMFRIQMSTKALTNIVPGGSAAGVRARLPADDAVGRQRARRRLRAGHRRARLGGRAQPHLLDRPARSRSRCAASTRCTSTAALAGAR